MALMSSSIDKDALVHLAKLSRIEYDPGEEQKLLTDLGAILDHFKELQALDTSDVPPMTGGTDLRNALRADDARESTDRGAGTGSFPKSKDGFNDVPAVFE